MVLYMKKCFVFVFILLSHIACFAEATIVVSSYPWQNMTIAEMLGDIKGMGVSKVSMFQNMKLGGGGKYKDTKFSYDMPDEAAAEAMEIFRAAGIRVVSIGHIYLKDEASIAKLFDFAKRFGIEAMTVEAQPETLDIYDRYARKYGIMVGLYNHPHRAGNVAAMKKYPYATPEKMLSALEGKSSLKAFPDCGHWGRSGFDIVACIKKLDGKVGAVNIQDLDSAGECEEYGKGRLPLTDFIAELKRQKFDGYCVVMFNVAKDGSQIRKVGPSVKFLENCGLKK